MNNTTSRKGIVISIVIAVIVILVIWYASSHSASAPDENDGTNQPVATTTVPTVSQSPIVAPVTQAPSSKAPATAPTPKATVITIISPNGGETVTPQGSNGISNITASYSSDFEGIQLVYLINRSGGSLQRKETGRAYDTKPGVTTILVDVGSQNGLPIVPAGQYKIKICDPTGASCAIGKDYFTITN